MSSSGIFANFPREGFRRQLNLRTRNDDPDLNAICSLRCEGGSFRYFGDDASDMTARKANGQGDGIAELDINFMDDGQPKCFGSFAYELQIVTLKASFPASYLPWFMGILDDIENSSKVMSFSGTFFSDADFENAKDSFGRFGFVILSAADRRIPSLTKEQRVEIGY